MMYTMNSSDAQSFHQYELIVAKAGMVSAAFTLLATSSIIVFIVYKRIYNNVQVKPLFHLSLADFMLSFLWISSSAAFLARNGLHSPHQTLYSCFVWQLLTEVIHLATFCFTVNYSINVYLLMKERAKRVYMDYVESVHGMLSPSAKKLEFFKNALYVISWILPVILMLPVIVHISPGHVSACQKCVILIDVPRLVNCNSSFIRAYGFIVLSFTLLASIIAIVTLYCLTLKLYWKAIPAYHTNRQRRQLKNMQRRISVYVVVFLMCWMPALIIAIIKSKETLEQRETHDVQLIDKFPLYVLQAILAPLQGFFNAIVYGWSRRSFREAIETVSPGPGDYLVSTPEFTSSYYDSPPNDLSEQLEHYENDHETIFDPENSRKTPLPF